MSAAAPTPASRPAAQRAFAALPDAVTASGFALLWVAPGLFGADALRTATLMMLIEFLIVHATAFIGGFALNHDRPRAARVAAILGFGLFYLGFVLAFAWSFRAWWPLPLFGWLLLSKLLAVFERTPDARKRARMAAGWGLSVLFYIGGVTLTSLLWIPRLGIDAAAQAAGATPGSGLWVDEPQRVVAFGLLYFGALAWAKWKGWDDRIDRVAKG